MPSTTVVLGGGVGGIVAANEIRRQLPLTHRVVLVDRNALHAFAPSFLWVMTGDRKPDRIRTPLADLVRPGVHLLQAEILGIDPGRRRVLTSVHDLPYDYLILALGADLAPDAVPGLPGSAHDFYTFDGAARLNHALAGVRGGSIAVVVSSLPYKCPGAPHEGAMLIASHFRRRGLRDRTKVLLFTPESQPMPVGGPQLGEAVRNMLESKGVEFHPLHRLAAVRQDARELTFDNGTRLNYDLLVAVPPHRAPKVVVEAGLANPAGWIPVDPQTLRTGQDGTYAIGDVTAIPIPGRWKPDVPLMLPKAGVFAHAQAEVVAKRVAAQALGRPCEAAFCGDGYCMLEAGENLAGFAFGNFFAEPAPQVRLRQIGKAWHVGKVLFEKWWLAPIGIRKNLVGWAVKAGGRLYGVPVSL